MDFQSEKKFWKAETESFPTIPSNCRRRRRCIQMCTNYNVDSNTRYSNYIELGIKCSN